MSANEHTYQRILSYLKGLLSGRQRHDLEREMMQDVFDDEAFEGLGRLSSEELESDMTALTSRLENRIQPAATRRLAVMLRIAAVIVLMAGIGSILYLVFRSPSQNLVTEEISREKHRAPAETAVPSVPGQSGISATQPVPDKEPDRTDIVKKVSEVREEMVTLPEPSAERSEQEAAKTTKSALQIVPVPAFEPESVSETESASESASESDMQDTAFMMQEDLMALDEVVVVAYGAKKMEGAGAKSSMEAKEFTPSRDGSPYEYVKPVPPGGSLKAFKSWVEKQLDLSEYHAFPGRNRIQITLNVKADGTLYDIDARDPAQPVIAEEIIRIIAKSPPWQPALKNNSPVESKVLIRFLIIVEAP